MTFFFDTFSSLLHGCYLLNLPPANLNKLLAFITFSPLYCGVYVYVLCIFIHTLAHAVEIASSKSAAQTRDLGKIQCYRWILSTEFPLLWRTYETSFHYRSCKSLDLECPQKADVCVMACMRRLEDSLGFQSSPSTLFEAGSLLICYCITRTADL